MDKLVEFYRARLAEDAAMAVAASPGPWSVGGVADDIGAADVVSYGGSVTSGRENPCCSTEDAAHIARHDPARVLREVESERQIVDLCATETPETGGLPLALRILRLKVQRYADHEDFRPEWA